MIEFQNKSTITNIINHVICFKQKSSPKISFLNYSYDLLKLLL